MIQQLIWSFYGTLLAYCISSCLLYLFLQTQKAHSCRSHLLRDQQGKYTKKNESITIHSKLLIRYRMLCIPLCCLKRSISRTWYNTALSTACFDKDCQTRIAYIFENHIRSKFHIQNSCCIASSCYSDKLEEKPSNWNCCRLLYGSLDTSPGYSPQNDTGHSRTCCIPSIRQSGYSPYSSYDHSWSTVWQDCSRHKRARNKHDILLHPFRSLLVDNMACYTQSTEYGFPKHFGLVVWIPPWRVVGS
jgi:hypothetical protein